MADDLTGRLQQAIPEYRIDDLQGDPAGSGSQVNDFDRYDRQGIARW